VCTHTWSAALGLPNASDLFRLVNHAARCACVRVGWGATCAGTDDASRTPYWIVKNSWGAQWGEGGYFRILRGSEQAGGECAIESLTVSAIPVLH